MRSSDKAHSVEATGRGDTARRCQAGASPQTVPAQRNTCMQPHDAIPQTHTLRAFHSHTHTYSGVNEKRVPIQVLYLSSDDANRAARMADAELAALSDHEGAMDILGARWIPSDPECNREARGYRRRSGDPRVCWCGCTQRLELVHKHAGHLRGRRAADGQKRTTALREWCRCFTTRPCGRSASTQGCIRYLLISGVLSSSMSRVTAPTSSRHRMKLSLRGTTRAQSILGCIGMSTRGSPLGPSRTRCRRLSTSKKRRLIRALCALCPASTADLKTGRRRSLQTARRSGPGRRRKRASGGGHPDRG